eukprot:jgi/Chrzof1/2083/Cz11g02050.t1
MAVPTTPPESLNFPCISGESPLEWYKQLFGHSTGAVTPMAELLPLVQPPLMSDNARRVVDTIERVCTSRLAEYLISLLASTLGCQIISIHNEGAGLSTSGATLFISSRGGGGSSSSSGGSSNNNNNISSVKDT